MWNSSNHCQVFMIEDWSEKQKQKMLSSGWTPWQGHLCCGASSKPCILFWIPYFSRGKYAYTIELPW